MAIHYRAHITIFPVIIHIQIDRDRAGVAVVGLLAAAFVFHPCLHTANSRIVDVEVDGSGSRDIDGGSPILAATVGTATSIAVPARAAAVGIPPGHCSGNGRINIRIRHVYPPFD